MTQAGRSSSRFSGLLRLWLLSPPAGGDISESALRTPKGWVEAEATIESGGLESVTEGRARFPTFAFSYQVSGTYYSGRFALVPDATYPEESLIDRMIGRKMRVRYDPRRPDVWLIPDKVMEGCKVEQKMGPHLIALYPKD